MPGEAVALCEKCRGTTPRFLRRGRAGDSLVQSAHRLQRWIDSRNPARGQLYYFASPV
jgi:hypothetical protein